MNDEFRFSDDALTRLLERAPAVDVPADFAARVHAALPQSLPRRHAVSAASVVAWVFAVAIAAALFVLAPHAQASVQSFGFWMEMLLIVELGGIAWWLAVKRGFAG